MKKDNAIREQKVFKSFLECPDSPYPEGIFESRKDPEPDILYHHPQEGPIAFELTEVCLPEIACARATLSANYIRTKSPT